MVVENLLSFSLSLSFITSREKGWRVGGGDCPAAARRAPLSMGERYFMISIFQWIKYYIL